MTYKDSTRQNNDIHGIQIGNKTFKIKQYADDTQVFSLFEPQSIKEIFKVFEEFSTISGLQINYTKTEVLRIGAIKDTAKMIETNEQLKWTNDCVDILGITVSTKMNEMIRLNIDPLIEKIKNIIKMWSWRKLTLYGKISIINALLSSQLIYRLSVLPTPQPDIMKSIDMTFYNYLWKDKPHKISKTVVTLPYDQGGIKMVDIYKKDQSLKITWIKRIWEEPEYHICPTLDKVNKIPTKLLFKCNLHSKDIAHCWKKLPAPFWVDMMQHWCEYNYTNIEDCSDDVLNEMIWFNSNIRVQNKPVFHKNMYDRNIMIIKDLVNENNNFLTFEEFKNKYQVNITFLDYYGLIHAIPQEYKQKIQSYANCSPQTKYKIYRLLQEEKFSKCVYTELIEKDKIFPQKIYERQQLTLNTTFSQEDFLELFKVSNTATLSTKLKDFQYRILHGALITNSHLFKWKIKPNDLCSFCQAETESMVHLLIRCQTSKNIWNSIIKIIYDGTGTRINLTEKEILLGVNGLDPFNKLINNINMITKQYLYACRCINKLPLITQLVHKIKEVREIEHAIYWDRDQENKFKEKWEILHQI